MINRLLITALLLCLLPVAAAFGQELRQEKLIGIFTEQNANAQGRIYAVFYSDGMPESAIWPLGMKLIVKDAKGNISTIRHTESKGNGENIAVNDKVPYRFIIAREDGGSSVTWAYAMGLNTDENSSLSADGTLDKTGCAAYSTPEFPTGWRLPTQREMMLMWLFKKGINETYSNGNLTLGDYWTATEEKDGDGSTAWFMSVSGTNPQMKTDKKSIQKKYRCVRDY